MADDQVGQTVLDLVGQLRRQNFNPELAEQATSAGDYTQIPPGYRPGPERPASSGYDYGSTFWDKLYGHLEGANKNIREGFGSIGTPGTSFTGPAQGLLGLLQGAMSIPSAATEQYVAEPIATSEGLQRTVGRVPAAAMGAVAEQLPYLAIGGKRTPGRLPGGPRDIGRRGSPIQGERRGPGRMSDEAWMNQQQAARRTADMEAQRATPKPMSDIQLERSTMDPKHVARLQKGKAMRESVQTSTPGEPQMMRDPISHRQTEIDPGFFGPLIANYEKVLRQMGLLR